MGRKWNFTGESFWARGYFVSTDEIDLSPSDRLDELLPATGVSWPQTPRLLTSTATAQLLFFA